eukprot:TRINITY_DN20461_c0_g1_i1.p1 TRINITY_DN20461_c0_g1~~TRINITY_DN20461_c0_g1_i1.p1  ORF type:complete len:4130 (+),score=948.07 TRINITY_DN20461_c0_g1_i1:134-12523(+)
MSADGTIRLLGAAVLVCSALLLLAPPGAAVSSAGGQTSLQPGARPNHLVRREPRAAEAFSALPPQASAARRHRRQQQPPRGGAELGEVVVTDRGSIGLSDEEDRERRRRELDARALRAFRDALEAEEFGAEAQAEPPPAALPRRRPPALPSREDAYDAPAAVERGDPDLVIDPGGGGGSLYEEPPEDPGGLWARSGSDVLGPAVADASAYYPPRRGGDAELQGHHQTGGHIDSPSVGEPPLPSRSARFDASRAANSLVEAGQPEDDCAACPGGCLIGLDKNCLYRHKGSQLIEAECAAIGGTWCPGSQVVVPTVAPTAAPTADVDVPLATCSKPFYLKFAVPACAWQEKCGWEEHGRCGGSGARPLNGSYYMRASVGGSGNIAGLGWDGATRFCAETLKRSFDSLGMAYWERSMADGKCAKSSGKTIALSGMSEKACKDAALDDNVCGSEPTIWSDGSMCACLIDGLTCDVETASGTHVYKYFGNDNETFTTTYLRALPEGGTNATLYLQASRSTGDPLTLGPRSNGRLGFLCQNFGAQGKVCIIKQQTNPEVWLSESCSGMSLWPLSFALDCLLDKNNRGMRACPWSMSWMVEEWAPTPQPTPEPTRNPTEAPTFAPTVLPTVAPTVLPPTHLPTPMPTPPVTEPPTPAPVPKPAAVPTPRPTKKPTPPPPPPPPGVPAPPATPEPTDPPTPDPTPEPATPAPTPRPSPKPTYMPTGIPTPKPTPEPTTEVATGAAEEVCSKDNPGGVAYKGTWKKLATDESCQGEGIKVVSSAAGGDAEQCKKLVTQDPDCGTSLFIKGQTCSCVKTGQMCARAADAGATVYDYDLTGWKCGCGAGYVCAENCDESQTAKACVQQTPVPTPPPTPRGSWAFVQDNTACDDRNTKLLSAKDTYVDECKMLAGKDDSCKLEIASNGSACSCTLYGQTCQPMARAGWAVYEWKTKAAATATKPAGTDYMVWEDYQMFTVDGNFGNSVDEAKSTCHGARYGAKAVGSFTRGDAAAAATDCGGLVVVFQDSPTGNEFAANASSGVAYVGNTGSNDQYCGKPATSAGLHFRGACGHLGATDFCSDTVGFKIMCALVPPKDEVVVDVEISGISYESIAGDAALASALKNTVAKSLAGATGASGGAASLAASMHMRQAQAPAAAAVDASDIRVDLSAGAVANSVVADAYISPPEGVSADAVQNSLSGSGSTKADDLKNSVAQDIQAMPEADRVITDKANFGVAAPTVSKAPPAAGAPKGRYMEYLGKCCDSGNDLGQLQGGCAKYGTKANCTKACKRKCSDDAACLSFEMYPASNPSNCFFSSTCAGVQQDVCDRNLYVKAEHLVTSTSSTSTTAITTTKTTVTKTTSTLTVPLSSSTTITSSTKTTLTVTETSVTQTSSTATTSTITSFTTTQTQTTSTSSTATETSSTETSTTRTLISQGCHYYPDRDLLGKGIKGKDPMPTYVTLESCCGLCEWDDSCTGFVWVANGPFSGGQCRLKQGGLTFAPAPARDRGFMFSGHGKLKTTSTTTTSTTTVYLSCWVPERAARSCKPMKPYPLDAVEPSGSLRIKDAELNCDKLGGYCGGFVFTQAQGQWTKVRDDIGCSDYKTVLTEGADADSCGDATSADPECQQLFMLTSTAECRCAKKDVLCDYNSTEGGVEMFEWKGSLNTATLCEPGSFNDGSWPADGPPQRKCTDVDEHNVPSRAACQEEAEMKKHSYFQLLANGDGTFKCATTGNCGKARETPGTKWQVYKGSGVNGSAYKRGTCSCAMLLNANSGCANWDSVTNKEILPKELMPDGEQQCYNECRVRDWCTHWMPRSDGTCAMAGPEICFPMGDKDSKLFSLNRQCLKDFGPAFDGFYKMSAAEDGLSSGCSKTASMPKNDCISVDNLATCKQHCVDDNMCNVINWAADESDYNDHWNWKKCCMLNCDGSSVNNLELKMTSSNKGWDVYFFDQSKILTTTTVSTTTTTSTSTSTATVSTTTETATSSTTSTASTRTSTTATSTSTTIYTTSTVTTTTTTSYTSSTLSVTTVTNTSTTETTTTETTSTTSTSYTATSSTMTETSSTTTETVSSTTVTSSTTSSSSTTLTTTSKTSTTLSSTTTSTTTKSSTTTSSTSTTITETTTSTTVSSTTLSSTTTTTISSTTESTTITTTETSTTISTTTLTTTVTHAENYVVSLTSTIQNVDFMIMRPDVREEVKTQVRNAIASAWRRKTDDVEVQLSSPFGASHMQVDAQIQYKRSLPVKRNKDAMGNVLLRLARVEGLVEVATGPLTVGTVEVIAASEEHVAKAMALKAVTEGLEAGKTPLAIAKSAALAARKAGASPAEVARTAGSAAAAAVQGAQGTLEEAVQAAKAAAGSLGCSEIDISRAAGVAAASMAKQAKKSPLDVAKAAVEQAKGGKCTRACLAGIAGRAAADAAKEEKMFPAEIAQVAAQAVQDAGGTKSDLAKVLGRIILDAQLDSDTSTLTAAKVGREVLRQLVNLGCFHMDILKAASSAAGTYAEIQGANAKKVITAAADTALAARASKTDLSMVVALATNQALKGSLPPEATGRLAGTHMKDSGADTADAARAAGLAAGLRAVRGGESPSAVSRIAYYAARSMGGDSKVNVRTSSAAAAEAAKAEGMTLEDVAKQAAVAARAQRGTPEDIVWAAASAAKEMALAEGKDMPGVISAALAAARETGVTSVDLSELTEQLTSQLTRAGGLTASWAGKVAAQEVKKAGGTKSQIARAAGFAAMQTCLGTQLAEDVTIREAVEAATKTEVAVAEVPIVAGVAAARSCSLRKFSAAVVASHTIQAVLDNGGVAANAVAAAGIAAIQVAEDEEKDPLTTGKAVGAAALDVNATKPDAARMAGEAAANAARVAGMDPIEMARVVSDAMKSVGVVQADISTEAGVEAARQAFAEGKSLLASVEVAREAGLAAGGQALDVASTAGAAACAVALDDNDARRKRDRRSMEDICQLAGAAVKETSKSPALAMANYFCIQLTTWALGAAKCAVMVAKRNELDPFEMETLATQAVKDSGGSPVELARVKLELAVMHGLKDPDELSRLGEDTVREGGGSAVEVCEGAARGVLEGLKWNLTIHNDELEKRGRDAAMIAGCSLVQASQLVAKALDRPPLEIGRVAAEASRKMAVSDATVAKIAAAATAEEAILRGFNISNTVKVAASAAREAGGSPSVVSKAAGAAATQFMVMGKARVVVQECQAAPEADDKKAKPKSLLESGIVVATMKPLAAGLLEESGGYADSQLARSEMANASCAEVAEAAVNASAEYGGSAADIVSAAGESAVTCFEHRQSPDKTDSGYVQKVAKLAADAAAAAGGYRRDVALAAATAAADAARKQGAGPQDSVQQAIDAAKAAGGSRWDVELAAGNAAAEAARSEEFAVRRAGAKEAMMPSTTEPRMGTTSNGPLVDYWAPNAQRCECAGGQGYGHKCVGKYGRQWCYVREPCEYSKRGMRGYYSYEACVITTTTTSSITTTEYDNQADLFSSRHQVSGTRLEQLKGQLDGYSWVKRYGNCSGHMFCKPALIGSLEACQMHCDKRGTGCCGIGYDAGVRLCSVYGGRNCYDKNETTDNAIYMIAVEGYGQSTYTQMDGHVTDYSSLARYGQCTTGLEGCVGGFEHIDTVEECQTACKHECCAIGWHAGRKECVVYQGDTCRDSGPDTAVGGYVYFLVEEIVTTTQTTTTRTTQTLTTETYTMTTVTTSTGTTTRFDPSISGHIMLFATQPALLASDRDATSSIQLALATVAGVPLSRVSVAMQCDGPCTVWNAGFSLNGAPESSAGDYEAQVFRPPSAATVSSSSLLEEVVVSSGSGRDSEEGGLGSSMLESEGEASLKLRHGKVDVSFYIEATETVSIYNIKARLQELENDDLTDRICGEFTRLSKSMDPQNTHVDCIPHQTVEVEKITILPPVDPNAKQPAASPFREGLVVAKRNYEKGKTYVLLISFEITNLALGRLSEAQKRGIRRAVAKHIATAMYVDRSDIMQVMLSSDENGDGGLALRIDVRLRIPLSLTQQMVQKIVAGDRMTSALGWAATEVRALPEIGYAVTGPLHPTAASVIWSGISASQKPKEVKQTGVSVYLLLLGVATLTTVPLALVLATVCLTSSGSRSDHRLPEPKPPSAPAASGGASSSSQLPPSS